MPLPLARFVLILCLCSTSLCNAQVLKSIIYDFDGLDIGATDLPEGDFQSGDLSAAVSANPLPPQPVLGDRCLKVQLNGAAAAFGRGIARYIEFDPAADRFNFFFYNPGPSNIQFDVVITDDDNQSNAYEGNADDSWKKSFSIAPSSGWQLYTTPLNQFTDNNTAGNGVMDMAFTNNQGMLLSVEFRFTGNGNPQTGYLDVICFTEGDFPHGATVFDLPSKNAEDYALLGVFTEESIGQYHLSASKFESLFTPHKKIRYVNTFIHWAYGTSTTPSEMPGAAAQTLLNDGYVPVLTWEPLFAGYDRLDPVQPRLQNIINGEFDAYIDAFAKEVSKLSDTIIIRVMHEFEGDWYPWSICKNNNDPQLYINAFRHFVNRFRSIPGTKVKWMWCVNSDYAPYAYYNWIVKAYPGAQYVDIVATDIYNNHYPVALPWWRSFRWQTTETYYYLTKYFPDKPFYICEVGCRERLNSESTASQRKGAWYAEMDRMMQSYYHKARALIFFNANPDQNWLVNSSPFALQSLQDNIWNDEYYFRSSRPPVIATPQEEIKDMYVFPNPGDDKVSAGIVSSSLLTQFRVVVTDARGRIIFVNALEHEDRSYSMTIPTDTWPRGIYVIEVSTVDKEGGNIAVRRQKISLL